MLEFVSRKEKEKKKKGSLLPSNHSVFSALEDEGTFLGSGDNFNLVLHIC